MENGFRLLFSLVVESIKQEGATTGEVLRLEDVSESGTLGRLLKETLRQDWLSEEEDKKLRIALKVRNHVVHRYWREATTISCTQDGRYRVQKQLRAIGDYFNEATKIVHRIIDRLLAPTGTSVQDFVDASTSMYESDFDFVALDEIIH